jgi:hypothetical protein
MEEENFGEVVCGNCNGTGIFDRICSWPIPCDPCGGTGVISLVPIAEEADAVGEVPGQQPDMSWFFEGIGLGKDGSE